MAFKQFNKPFTKMSEQEIDDELGGMTSTLVSYANLVDQKHHLQLKRAADWQRCIAIAVGVFVAVSVIVDVLGIFGVGAERTIIAPAAASQPASPQQTPTP